MPRPFSGIGGTFGGPLCGSGWSTHTQHSTMAAPITLPTSLEELPVVVGLPSEMAPSDTSTGTFPPHVPAEMLPRSMPASPLYAVWASNPRPPPPCYVDRMRYRSVANEWRSIYRPHIPGREYSSVDIEPMYR